MKKIFLFLTCACTLMGCKHSLSSSEIRINQVGFAPEQEKTATIDVCTADAAPCSVCILSEMGDTVWAGLASATMRNPISGKPRQIVDFSALTTPGTYHLIASSPHHLIAFHHHPSPLSLPYPSSPPRFLSPAQWYGHRRTICRGLCTCSRSP